MNNSKINIFLFILNIKNFLNLDYDKNFYLINKKL